MKDFLMTIGWLLVAAIPAYVVIGGIAGFWFLGKLLGAN